MRIEEQARNLEHGRRTAPRRHRERREPIDSKREGVAGEESPGVRVVNSLEAEPLQQQLYNKTVMT